MLHRALTAFSKELLKNPDAKVRARIGVWGRVGHCNWGRSGARDRRWRKDGKLLQKPEGELEELVQEVSKFKVS